jgi:simple sugar transport system ATP-binding protein
MRKPERFWEVSKVVAVLELTNISKHFGAIQAVNDVSLSLEAGQVVGLMGDNGAGKSTLVKMIAGNFRPSEGTIRLDGAEIVMHRRASTASRSFTRIWHCAII